MKITRENLEKLKKTSEEHQETARDINKYEREIRQRYGDNEIEIERDGEKVKIKEKALWQELAHLNQGVDTGAKDILKEKYPKFFEKLDNFSVSANGVRQLEADIFGAPFSQMSAKLLVEVIEGIMDLKIKEEKVGEILKNSGVNKDEENNKEDEKVKV